MSVVPSCRTGRVVSMATPELVAGRGSPFSLEYSCPPGIMLPGFETRHALDAMLRISGVIETQSMLHTGTWPRLALDEWAPTQSTLHRWTQIVGKTRLALAPMQNHWWQVALYITARGLGTSPIPHGARTFEVDFDFVDHRLLVRTSDGRTESLPLVPRTVADFHACYLDALRSLGIEPKIRPVPNEVANPLQFD